MNELQIKNDIRYKFITSKIINNNFKNTFLGTNDMKFIKNIKRHNNDVLNLYAHYVFHKISNYKHISVKINYNIRVL